MIAGLYQRGSMKMISSKLVVLNEVIKGESSRSNAIQAREKIIELLKKFEIIEIDLQNSNFTPSVADEIIGSLALTLGSDSFKHRIKILNASDSQISLMKHVIARRLENSHKTRQR